MASDSAGMWTQRQMPIISGSNSNNISVTASGDVSVARGSMEVSGATTLNIAGKLLATATSGDWSNFVMGAGLGHRDRRLGLL